MPPPAYDSDEEYDREHEWLMKIARGPQVPPFSRPSQPIAQSTSHTDAADAHRAGATAVHQNTGSSGQNSPRNVSSSDGERSSSSYGTSQAINGSGKRASDASIPAVTGGSSSGVKTEKSSSEHFRIRKKSRTNSSDVTVKVESSSRDLNGQGLSKATTPVPSMTTPVAENSSSAVIRVAIPDWYRRLKKSTSRQKDVSDQDQKLGTLKGYIAQSLDLDRRDRQSTLDKLIEAIHDAMFLEVTGQLVRDHRLLDDVGLQAIFNLPPSQSDKYPFYTRLDAEELWHKWATKDFGTDLMHGLRFDKDSAPAIKSTFVRPRNGDVHGNNDLVNGQWWPLQLCLVRDGAHISAQGGIGGRSESGAFSVVMSSGQLEGGGHYPDVDDGDTVLYCGTDGKEGQVSENTQRLIESYEQKSPIRLIRSSKAVHGTSKFRPEQGFRYDGLYHIASVEILDRGKQRHRFKMLRNKDQDPIRWEGPGKRPTRQELAAVEKLKREKKFMNAEM